MKYIPGSFINHSLRVLNFSLLLLQFKEDFPKMLKFTEIRIYGNICFKLIFEMFTFMLKIKLALIGQSLKKLMNGNNGLETFLSVSI